MSNRELLIALLRTLRHIQQTINAIYNQQRPDSSEQKPPTQIDLQSAIRVPPAIHDYYASEQRDRPKKTRVENARLALECIGVVAAIFAGIYTFRTLDQVGKQADAAQRQVSIMQRQLEATDRPWVEVVSATSTNGLQFFRKLNNRHPGLDAEFSIKGKNIGHSVALHVKATSRVIFGIFDPESLLKIENAVCREQKPLYSSEEITLFPDRDSGNRLTYGIAGGYPQDLPTEALMPRVQGVIGISVFPVIVGCITYQIPNALGRIHHTGFAYEFQRSEFAKRPGVYQQSPFDIRSNIPASGIVLIEPQGFGDAD
jgi:hypothetical protein